MWKYCLPLLFFIKLQAQDTLRVMHYNVLNYGASGVSCPDISEKNANLKKIIKFKNPDIFTVNELVTDMVGGQNAIAKSILDNVLNTDGITHYERAYDTGIGSQVNMLFYNSDLLTLYAQDVIINDVSGGSLTRYIDVYRLYYKDITPDTVFIEQIVAHLKAANTPDDILDRARETEAVIDYLENNPTHANRMMSGDFNVKTAAEDAFQNLINPSNASLRFEDPINQPGEWNNNSAYRHIHTQSTHTTGSCFSTGGMDDRFDFILTSSPIIDGDQGLRYIQDSYEAVGQDGNLFNQAMPTTGTGTVDATISSALYNLSDHLPVYLELYADPSTVSIPEELRPKTWFSVTNPVNNQIILRQSGQTDVFQVELRDVQGALLLQEVWDSKSEKSLHINNISNIKSGFYILTVYSKNEPYQAQSLKLVIVK